MSLARPNETVRAGLGRGLGHLLGDCRGQGNGIVVLRLPILVGFQRRANDDGIQPVSLMHGPAGMSKSGLGEPLRIARALGALRPSVAVAVQTHPVDSEERSFDVVLQIFGKSRPDEGSRWMISKRRLLGSCEPTLSLLFAGNFAGCDMRLLEQLFVTDTS